MTDYDVIIAEWFEETVNVPLAPTPEVNVTPVPTRASTPEHFMRFQPAIARRKGFTQPPMQKTVVDKKRKGYDAQIFNRLDTILDIEGHDEPIVKNGKPAYNFGGHKHDKRIKCNWAKLDRYYASLETDNE